MNKKFRDVSGARLKIGDIVRVLGVPDLSGMHVDRQAESLPVFQHLVGKYKKIDEFDEFGLVWLSFRIHKVGGSEYHSVGIEPHLLRLRRFRTTPDANG